MNDREYSDHEPTPKPGEEWRMECCGACKHWRGADGSEAWEPCGLVEGEYKRWHDGACREWEKK